ncbi:MAG TPA: trigger factor [Fimbriimonadaceae bacterium]|nr:trigger factor [Fimbriimonadaceae bacterium]
MNVVVEPLPNCLATLRVEVEPEKVAQAKEQLIKEYGQVAKIPGYRPGKAPRAVIEKKFKKQIHEDLEGKLLRDSAREAIKEKNLRVLQISNVEDVQFEDGKGLSFTATVITQPEFELPDYKGLPLEVKPAEVTDDEIEESIQNLREQAADFIDLTEDRGAQMDDFAVVDYEGAIDGRPVHDVFPKAGKPLTANSDFWIRMTDEAFFPGYCANLVGAKPGETREFDIDVPGDFPVEGMPGQKIHYKVTVKALKQKVLPELDDAFASNVAKDKTLAELRQMAREELGRQKATERESSKRSQIMKHLLSRAECELPTGMVRNETQRILNDIVKENQERGVTEEVLKENERELVGVASQNARERLKGTFILLRIAEKEGLRVTREELFGRIATLAQRYQMTFEKMLKELEKRNGLDQINEEILTAKVLDFLLTNASVTDAPPA